MAIQDRDYMKKHREEVRRRSRSVEDRMDDAASEFLARHPRFLLYTGIGLGALLLLALILSEVFKG